MKGFPYVRPVGDLSREAKAYLDRAGPRSMEGDLLRELIADIPYGGGTLHLGPGYYRVVSGYDIDVDNLEIVGCREAIIDMTLATMTISGNHTGIRGCTITADSATSTLMALTGEGSYLEDCWFDGVVERRVELDAKYVRVENCKWTSTGTATLIYGYAGHKGYCICGNRMDADGARGLDLIFVENPTDNGGATATLVLIDNNWTDSRITYPVAQTAYGDNVATPRGV